MIDFTFRLGQDREKGITEKMEEFPAERLAEVSPTVLRELDDDNHE